MHESTTVHTGAVAEEVAEREKQVWQELGILGRVLRELDLSLTDLRGELMCVMTPERVEAETDNFKPSELVELAQAVRENRWHAEDMRDRVDDVLDRLEI